MRYGTIYGETAGDRSIRGGDCEKMMIGHLKMMMGCLNIIMASVNHHLPVIGASRLSQRFYYHPYLNRQEHTALRVAT